MIQTVISKSILSAEDFNKNPERVAAGLKATVHNPNATADARSSAAQRLREMNVDPEEPLSSRNAKEVSGETGQRTHGGAKSSAEVHEHHIMGGYKAALKNPNASPEAKQHAEKMLAQHHKTE
ncbi:hypothetical protein BDN70DRAFT_847505 [Pholiota conissans]|uniref:Conidiation-specific protein 6 n=1 Tax=Pholiota conissans TaxID=109636 RepID=A0A9P6D7A0_9AGAR|nr:hypothetical protein BDN70DRAFT_847505 [Pholiota conissans]